MGMVITAVIAALIVVYAFFIIRKSVRQVKAGKCMSCSSSKSDDCHCHELHGIIDLGEGEQDDKKN